MKVEVKFLAFYANVPQPSIRHCFSCGSWLAWRNNTKLKTLDQRSLIGVRLIFNKNYVLAGGRGRRKGRGGGGEKGAREESAEIKKFTGAPSHSMAS